MEKLVDVELTFVHRTKWTKEEDFLDEYTLSPMQIKILEETLKSKKQGEKIFFAGNLTLEFSEKIRGIGRVDFGKQVKEGGFADLTSMEGCFFDKDESYLIDKNSTYIMLDVVDIIDDLPFTILIDFATRLKPYTIEFELENLEVGDYTAKAGPITIKFSLISLDMTTVRGFI